MLRPTLYGNRTSNLNSFWTDPFEAINSFFPAFWGDNGTNLEKSFSNFATDVVEKEDEYILQAELPGFAREDISVDLRDDVLTITARHNEETNEEDKESKYLRRERRTSSYCRSFRVQNVQPEDIDASYTNGVLEIRFPK